MPGPSMNRHASRERAERVVLARAVLRKPWREIMQSEGFRSVGAVQQTYKRELARRNLSPRELGKLTAQEIMERRDAATRIAVSQLFEARAAGDTSGVAAMLREIRANDVETAKMLGLYEPERVDVSVSSDPSAILADARDRWLEAIRLREQQSLSAPVLEAEVIP